MEDERRNMRDLEERGRMRWELKGDELEVRGSSSFLDIQGLINSGEDLASEKNGLQEFKGKLWLSNKKLLIISFLIINNTPLSIFFSIEVVNSASFSGGKFKIVSKSAVVSWLLAPIFFCKIFINALPWFGADWPSPRFSRDPLRSLLLSP